METTVKKLPHSQVELKFTLDPVKLEVAREAAFDKLSTQVKVPGFRPGKAPRKMLEEHMNPSAPMQQALDEVLNQAFQEAVRQEELVPIAQPEINISSVDLTKPIEVVATVQVRPEVEVGNWQKIKVAKEPATVDDAKVEETVKTVFERYTAEDAGRSEAPAAGGLVDAQGNPLTKSEPVEAKMDDAWAQKLGAKDLADLRVQIRADLESHGQYEAESAWQDKVLEEIIGLTKTDLPEAFVNDEISRMRAQFEQQLSSLQVSMDQYVQQSGKTQEEIEEQWKPQAIKQATMEVALAEIAHQAKIEATEEDVEAELAKADPKVRAQFADPQQRYYLTYSLWRQKVLKHILEIVEQNSQPKADKK